MESSLKPLKVLNDEHVNETIGFFYFTSLSNHIMHEGDIIESQPKGLFLKHSHGQLLVYKESESNTSSSTILWQTRPYFDDGSSIRSVARFQSDCNILIQSESFEKGRSVLHSILWTSGTQQCFAPGENRSLGWHPSRNELVIKASDLKMPLIPVGGGWNASDTRLQRDGNVLGEKQVDSDRFFLVNSEETILTQGFVLESDPPGLFLQFDNGNLFLRKGEPNAESSTLLWETKNAYVYDGDPQLTWSKLQNDCNFLIYGQLDHDELCYLWTILKPEIGLVPVEKCFLSWIPSEQRLAINSGDRYSIGQELWTSKDFTWEPINQNLSATEQTLVSVLTRVSSTLSFFGSGLIIVIILLRWIKNKKMFATRDRLIFSMSVLDLFASISHALDVSPLPIDSYGVIGAIGNQATCTAQGFFIQMGFGVPLYNCMLCLYTLFIVRFKITDHAIATRIEPCMHLIGLGYAVTTSSIGVFLNLYNSNGSFCWIEPYPMYCDAQDKIKCLRGENAYLFQWILAGIGLVLSFVVITATMGSIYFTIRQNNLTMKKRYGRQAVNNLQLNEVGKQAFLYVLAFMMTFSWPVAVATMRHAGVAVPIWLNACLSLFLPFQGVWNVIIFLRPTFIKLRRQYKDKSYLWIVKSAILKEISIKNRTSSQRRRPRSNMFNSNSSFQIKTGVKKCKSSFMYSGKYFSPQKEEGSNESFINSKICKSHISSNEISIIPKDEGSDDSSIKMHLKEMKELEDKSIGFIRYQNNCTSASTHRGDALDHERVEKAFKRVSLKINEGSKLCLGNVDEDLDIDDDEERGEMLHTKQDSGPVVFRDDTRISFRGDLDQDKIEKAFKRASIKSIKESENGAQRNKTLEQIFFREDAFASPRRDLDHEKLEKAFKQTSPSHADKPDINIEE